MADRFTDLPLEQGITRLLRKHLRQLNYAVVTDQKTGVPTAIHILGGERSTATSTVANAPSPSEAVTEPPRLRPTERGVPPPSTRREGRPSSIEQALDAARTPSAPEAQIQALLALGNFQDARTLEVLGAALQSEAAEVRQAALEAMRWGTVYDAAALADVRAVAAFDPDPALRQAALEVVVRYDEGPEARALLDRLAGEGGAYRDFALRELERMDREAEARSQPDTQVTPQ